jgi:hypothetical protein
VGRESVSVDDDEAISHFWHSFLCCGALAGREEKANIIIMMRATSRNGSDGTVHDDCPIGNCSTAVEWHEWHEWHQSSDSSSFSPSSPLAARASFDPSRESLSARVGTLLAVHADLEKYRVACAARRRYSASPLATGCPVPWRSCFISLEQPPTATGHLHQMLLVLV